MIENGLTIAVSFVLAVVVTLVADLGFDQHWNFFLVWLFITLAAYGTVFIIDDDLDFL